MDTFSAFAVLLLWNLIFSSGAISQQDGNSCIQDISLVDGRETMTVIDAPDADQTVQFKVKFRDSCSEQQMKDEDVTIERLSHISGRWLPLCTVDPESSAYKWCSCEKTKDSLAWRCNFTDTFRISRPQYKFLGNGFQQIFNITFVKADTTKTQTYEKQTTTSTTTNPGALEHQVTLDLEAAFTSGGTSDQSSQALTMVPFGVSIIAVNGVVLTLIVVLFVCQRKRGKRSTSSDLAMILAELQHNGRDQTNPGPGRNRIYEEIHDSTSLSRPPRCGVNRQGQVRQSSTTLPSVHFDNSLSADVNYLHPPAPATNQQRAVGNRKPEAPPTSAKNRYQAPPTLGRGRSQSIACPARNDWVAIPTPTREDGSSSRAIFRSESDTSLAVCTREQKSEQSQSHAQVETEVMQIIAKLASVAAAQSTSTPPTIIPNSQPASPQHIYSGLRSLTTPSAHPDSESTLQKFIYTAGDSSTTPTRKTSSQSVTSKQLASKEDQSRPLDLTLTRSSTKCQLSEDTGSKQEDVFGSVSYDPNPASETFLKTVGDPATRPRAQNIYERSTSTGTARGTKDKFGPQKTRTTTENFANSTVERRGAKAVVQHRSTDYLHPVTPDLEVEPVARHQRVGQLDEEDD